uniref:MFS transporter n=1 Tax=Heterorhabditis bacteriophora TaxID=37862 RepID=A0A1I7WTJ0_HETBA
MGTFTVPFFLRKAVWDKRGYWALSAVIFYFGRCWEQAGYTKAEMMKVGVISI